MHNDLIAFGKKENLFDSNSKLLLAVSGGIDSVVMVDLFFKSGIECGIAHCNFQLRGDESLKDEEFVRDLAKKYNMPLYVERFDTLTLAKEKGLSIQIIARELRYNWFDQIRKDNGHHATAVAHHQDDAIETFFINLIRGTGISGLGGIRIKINNIIRPLMFSNREGIASYAKNNNIQYREDSSNKETKYTRNKIRHQLIPLIEQINPSFRPIMNSNFHRLQEASGIYSSSLTEIQNKIMTQTDEGWIISIEGLMEYEYKGSLLHFILQDFGFTPGMIPDVLNILHSQPGKMVCSDHYRLIRDREFLFLTALKESVSDRYYLEDFEHHLEHPVSLQFKMLKEIDLQQYKNQRFAILDLDKVGPPWILRKWQHGDSFIPFGMTGFKKVSDYLIDHKIPITEKDNTWVLTAGEKIVWLIGQRIDERFKITDQTQNVLLIELKR